MGDLRPDNPSDDGSGRHRGLPDVPPEWGTVIIPDDPSELAAEVAEVRRELRRERRRKRLRAMLGLQSGRDGDPPLSVPVVVIAVALLTTLISLFVVTLGRPASPPLPPVDSAAPEAAQAPSTEIADVVLVDASGVRVRLGSLLPAVVLLVDGCDCEALVIDTALEVPDGVRVVPVAGTAPLIYGAPVNVRALADADGILRQKYAAGTSPGLSPRADPATTAIAVMVNGAGEVVGTFGPFDSVNELEPALDKLGQ